MQETLTLAQNFNHNTYVKNKYATERDENESRRN